MSHPEVTFEAIAERIRAALDDGRAESLTQAVAGLSAARLADALEVLELPQRTAVWRHLEPQRQGRVLVECHREVREQLIAGMSREQLAAAVQRLDLDDLSDIDDELPPEVLAAVLQAMDAQRRARFEVVRAYPDATAGGLMNVDTLAVRPDITLKVVMRYLALVRARLGQLPEELDAVNVVDAAGKYLGRLPLADLVSLAARRQVQEVMDIELAPFRASASAADVVRAFEDRNLVSAPVVDDSGRLIGRITVDDVLNLVRAQGDHAAMASAGLEGGADTFAPAWSSARRRAVWLGVNLVNALLAAAVVAHFDATIERIVALAVLMPVVSSMGGVAGTQSLALVIRGIALEQVNRANRWRLMRREVAVAVINGLLWALTVGLLAGAWYGRPALAAIFGAAVVINLLAGVVVGTLIPQALTRLHIDSAIAGQVLLVVFTDTFGFFVFLGMAAALL